MELLQISSFWDISCLKETKESSVIKMWAILSYFIKLHRFCMTLSDYEGYAPNIRPLEMRFFTQIAG